MFEASLTCSKRKERLLQSIHGLLLIYTILY